MFLTVISILLSITLKILFISLKASVKVGEVGAKVGAGIANSALAKKNPKLAQASAIAAQITFTLISRVLMIFIIVVDMIVTLILMGWVGIILLAMMLVIAIIGGWWVTTVVEPSEGFVIGSTSNAPKINDLPQDDADAPLRVAGMPPVAKDKKDIGKTMVQISTWAMENRPEGCYLYMQGDTDSCHYDCSTWVTAHLEMAGWYWKGNTLVPREGDRYIIGKNRKRDLLGYNPTGPYFSNPPAGTDKGTFNGPQDVGKLKPGDFLVSWGHIAMYMGEINGKHVISEASSDSLQQYLFEDPELTKPIAQVGFRPLYQGPGHKIIRMSDAT